jgi:hypothetical protein
LAPHQIVIGFNSELFPQHLELIEIIDFSPGQIVFGGIA